MNWVDGTLQEEGRTTMPNQIEGHVALMEIDAWYILHVSSPIGIKEHLNHALVELEMHIDSLMHILSHKNS